jgi:hypothetical protein
MEDKMKRTRASIALGVLLLAALACSVPGIPGAATPTPVSGDTVGTLVAATLTALASSSPAPAPSDTPAPPSALLPHSLYYLSKNAAGIYQVFRLEADGVTIHQLTDELADVQGFDVLPADGRIAFAANNQLIVSGADGSGRTVVVDGGPTSDETPYPGRLFGPVWVPDGTAIAFHYNGLSFYQFGPGTVATVLTDQINPNSGFPILQEGYTPAKYSPNGSKLLVSVQYYEAGTLGVYNPTGGSLTKFTSPTGGVILGTSAWAPDSASVLLASQYYGYVSPGLERYNAADGSGVALIASPSETDLNFVEAPLLAPDGQLYYFFSHVTSAFAGGNVPLQMVRSAPDGVTGRTVLRPESFTLIEALWAPDASLAVVDQLPPSDLYIPDGPLSLVYADGRPIVPLPVAAAHHLRWGP